MSKKDNILILSAGGRVKPIQDFKTEAAKFSDGTRMLTADVNPRMSSACHISDGAFFVPSIQSEDYIDRIFDLATEENIGLAIPTIDTELYKLSGARTRFGEAGTHIVTSDSELVALRRGKRKAVGLFARHSIRSPEVYGHNRLVYLYLTRPYNGNRTIGARRLGRIADLTPGILASSKPMFYQLIDIAEEFQEFTVDMYYDRKGCLKCTVPHERLEVHTGEVSKGAARRNSLYDLLTGNMAVLGGACGCITAQFFFNGRNDALYGVEINLRSGGGFPLTYAAGRNYPGWLVREYLYGEEIPFSDRWKNNLVMLRYSTKVLVHKQD